MWGFAHGRKMKEAENAGIRGQQWVLGGLTSFYEKT
jgi:hypothetical protein